MRYSVSLIFGGVALSAFWLAFVSLSWPISLQILALSVHSVASVLTMLIVLGVGFGWRRASGSKSIAPMAEAILMWAGAAYLVINAGAIASLGLAASAGQTPPLLNHGLATSLTIWTIAQGGYALVVAAISPFFITYRTVEY